MIIALTALPLAAQTTTGTLRGYVKDEAGAGLPGATVDATNDASGVTRSVVTGTDGFYNLAVNPGTYTVKASIETFGADTKKVVVLLGQTQGVDFLLSLRASQNVTVTAEAPVIETKQSEIATNVTEQQLRVLPQDNRNFLNFANLAPGVRTATDENNKEVLGGAVPGFNTNVFIDGTSYKNDVLNGGVVGQDSSRGNPFPQNAVQEFRVVTQNFKAEYEKSSSLLITAITKSGGNDFHGDGFAEYQNKDLVATDQCAEFVRCTGAPRVADFTKPDYTRWQAGVSLGGPIIQDRLHFFGSWEYNDQQRNSIVSFGPQASKLPPDVFNELQPLTGNFPSPFKENLAFGKVSWQAHSSDVVDFSGFYRHENEVKDVGNQRAFEAGTDIINGVWNVQAKNSWLSARFLNETTVGYNSYQWNPSSVVPGVVGRDYQQALRVGSSDNLQNFHQKRFSVRDDFTMLDLRGFGDHVVKIGAVFNANTYDVQKQFNGIPIYRFRPDIPAGAPYGFPFEAALGFGNPDLSIKNNQFGIYLQDDWTINPQLTVNLGLRWDYETRGLNNDYVTPALVRSELSPFFGPEFFTDGSNRPTYKNAFQPRVGFAYDLSKKGTTVFFGGYGRYTDRVEYNAILDEQFRLQYTTLTFRFSADGLDRDGQHTIIWNDSYLTQAGLQAIIDSGTGPKPEVFLINNNTHPPYSDQFTAGIRQQFGMIGLSLSYAGVRSHNGWTWIFGNRNPNGSCCQSLAPDFGNVLLSDATKKAWYDALFVQATKQYTASSKWGATLAYTYGHATANGGDFFTLDYIDPAHSPRHRAPQDERHRIVLSGIVGLPWDMTLSTLLQLGTGVGFTITDASEGFGFGQFKVRLNDGFQQGTLPFQQWDLALQKDVYFTQQARVGVRASVFNLTNHNNYGCFDGFIPPAGETNANFGTPDCLIVQPRRFQFGLQVGF
ncbi:MAG: TonB-dependent receptor [Thermoanaerobaculia bacterium]